MNSGISRMIREIKDMLKGKNVILGVTGSIAAYKIASLASALKKLSCNVDVIMTENACNFINPITFETLTGNKCLVDTFDRNFQYSVEHVSLAKKADLFLVAPASANFIGKAANGIADDMLTTTFMACECKKIVSPVINPASGYLACGDTGEGKMPEPEVLLSYILRELAHEKDMKGLKVCVTAGPTRETIDPVRFISNRSTGKMGFALAKNAMERGADVTLVSGPVELKDVPFVKMVHVESARQMFEAVTKEAETADQYIEKFSHENGKKYDIVVATSDGLEQIIIRGAGCRLMSARELKQDVARVEKELAEFKAEE